MCLILNKHEVAGLLSMKECLEVVEKAFLEMYHKSVILPMRSTIRTEKGNSLYMPAYLDQMKALACKVVTVFKDNPGSYQMPVTLGKIFLQDPNNGEVICIMDGSYLTTLRTGAASGVATKYLAVDKEKMNLGIIGCGVQAKMQIAAIAEVRNIRGVKVYDISKIAAKKFVEELKPDFNFNFEISGHPDEVLNADIICTATSSAVPVFDGRKVKEGTHVNGIGSHTPTTRELDSMVIARSKFVGDSKEACFSEAGDFIIPLQNKEIKPSHFYAELGEVIAGKKTGRLSEKEITVFKSNGLAIQDAAVAKLVYEKAREQGIGKEIEI